jgi:hypothetical protein
MTRPPRLTVLAHSKDCDGGDCPTIYRDVAGNIGIQGTTQPGATTEHISWMTREEFSYLLGQLD